MPTCKLCLKNEANQTGSHITSCFMVESQIGKRGQEQGFIIEPDSTQDYSKNVEADEIKEDYILCLGCEKRLSFLETYFSAEVTQKKEVTSFAQNFPVDTSNPRANYMSCQQVNPSAFYLLLYSIIWRISISNKQIFSQFNLAPENEEKMRLLVDCLLPEYVEVKVSAGRKFVINEKQRSWFQGLNACANLFDFLPMVLLKAHPNIDDTTRNIIFANNQIHLQPHHLIINEYIILLFFDRQNLDFKDDFFDLSKKYDLPFLINTDLSVPKIGLMEQGHWHEVRQMLIEMGKEQRRRHAGLACIEEFKKQRIIPTMEQLNDCVKAKLTQFIIDENDES